MNTLTKSGAAELARKCTAWWRERGYTTVKFSIEPMSREEGAGQQFFAVRSNLDHYGMPPRTRAPRARPLKARDTLRGELGEALPPPGERDTGYGYSLRADAPCFEGLPAGVTPAAAAEAGQLEEAA